MSGSSSSFRKSRYSRIEESFLVNSASVLILSLTSLSLRFISLAWNWSFQKLGSAVLALSSSLSFLSWSRSKTASQVEKSGFQSLAEIGEFRNFFHCSALLSYFCKHHFIRKENKSKRRKNHFIRKERKINRKGAKLSKSIEGHNKPAWARSILPW